MSESPQSSGIHPPFPDPTREQLAALEVLAAARVVLLTGHERPDGDCLGSQAALARILASRGQTAIVVNPDAPDARYAEVTRLADFRVDDGGPLPDHDLVVMLDGGDLSRTGVLAGRLTAAPSKKIVVDHHVPDGGGRWDAAFVDVTASATGVLVRRIGHHLGYGLDAETARALFTTLVTDTGWFRYSNTDAETLAIAAELLGHGVRPAELFGDLHQRQPLDHPRTLAAALSRTTYYADGQIALVDLPLDPNERPFDFDSDAVLDVLRSVEAVDVALVLRAIGTSRCKLSARAKGAFDVQRLAKTFGGGGHVKAAGATIELSLIEARAALVDRTLAQLGATVERRSEPRSTSDAARDEHRRHAEDAAALQTGAMGPGAKGTGSTEK